MKHLGNELRKYLDSNQIVKKSVAEKIGITPTYLSILLNKESFDCALLDKICRVISLSPAYFFDDYSNGNSGNVVGDVNASSIHGNTNVSISQGEVEMLKKLIEEKERTIKILMKAKGFDE